MTNNELKKELLTPEELNAVSGGADLNSMRTRMTWVGETLEAIRNNDVITAKNKTKQLLGIEYGKSTLCAYMEKTTLPDNEAYRAVMAIING